MIRDEMVRLIRKSALQLIAEQHELLELDVTERALCHHLASYICKNLQDFSRSLPESCKLYVDVEYNKHKSDPKRVNIKPRRTLSNQIRAVTVYPDIIIHQRDTDEHNLLVLEMKKPNQRWKEVQYDCDKLRAFRDELHYKHAAHIIVGKAINSEGFEIQWVDT